MQPASPQQGNGTAPSGTAAALRQIGAPDHAGYMKKKGERYGTWKMRYFVLKGPHLYYMNSEQVRACMLLISWQELTNVRRTASKVTSH
jgi:hypothetical protein